jgi:hypothetical protein
VTRGDREEDGRDNGMANDLRAHRRERDADAVLNVRQHACPEDAPFDTPVFGPMRRILATSTTGPDNTSARRAPGRI